MLLRLSLFCLTSFWFCCCLFSVCGRRGDSSLFCYALLCVLSSFAINSHGIRELFALHLLSSSRHVAVNILCLFPMVSCVGLRCVIVIFSGNTHLLFYVCTTLI